MDLATVRSRFPALDTPWALLDSAGGSAPASPVIRRVEEHLARRPVQLGASYPLSEEAGAAVRAGREAAALLLGATPEEVVLGPSSTELFARLARSLAPLWRPGDEVVVSEVDHEANRGPWRRLAELGLVVREWPLDRASARLRLEDLEPLLGPRTRLVAFTHCANVVGEIHDVRRIAARVREAGALSVVDGVAYAPHRRVDARALGVDAYGVSLYKVYGPHLGALYVRRELLLEARGLNHDFYPEDRIPEKLEPGGVCHELVAGLPGILEHMDALDAELFDAPADPGQRLERTFDAIAQHEMALVAPLLDFLGARPGVRLHGSAEADPDRRVPTVAFSVAGMPSQEVVRALEAHRVATRFGHFYAPRGVAALGLEPEDGIVRASLVHYHTPAEVERLLEALDGALPRS